MAETDGFISSGVKITANQINDLIKDIEIVLGLNNDYCAVLIGVGSLGTALLNYGGFTNYGLKIIAAFDNKVELINKEVNGIKVYDINYLKDYIANENVHIGIITVPRDYAQDVANLLVEAGIEAIWNFAPVSLVVKEGVIVSNMDMAQSLATLSHKLYLSIKRLSITSRGPLSVVSKYLWKDTSFFTSLNLLS